MIGLLTVLVLNSLDAGSAAESPNVMRRASVRKNQGVAFPDRVADGIAPSDGDVWDSPWTTRFDKGGVLEWDLGSRQHLSMFRLQADNNDFYHLQISDDGEQWKPAWTAKPVDIPGMQTRTSEPLDLDGRYLRLTAEGGDGMYSLGELEIFESQATMSRASLQRILPPPPPPPAPINTAHLLVLGVAGIGAYLLYRTRRDNLALRPTPTSPPADAAPKP
jgi:hypothetical protein